MLVQAQSATKSLARARGNKEDIKKFGDTAGCHGCRAISRGSPAENHSEECRARIESELLKAGGQKARKVQEGQERASRKRAAENPVEEPRGSTARKNEEVGRKRDREEQE